MKAHESIRNVHFINFDGSDIDSSIEMKYKNAQSRTAIKETIYVK